MSDVILSLSNVINVQVLPTPQGLGAVNINTAALISKEVPSGWGPSEKYRIYTNATDVATDFGSDSDAFYIAGYFFAQHPNPLLTRGYLAIVPRLQAPSLESIKDAIIRTGNLVYYFGILTDEEMSEVDFVALTAYVQTIDKVLFYCSSNIADLEPGSMLDDVRTASKNHTRCFYHGNSLDNTQQFAAAYAARALSVDFAGSRTTMTMHLKVLVGLTPDETMAQTQLNKAIAAGIDTYVSIAGVPELFTSGGNRFWDQVYNEFWLKFALEVAGFNYLAQTNYKIPQTEAGMEGLKNAYRKICQAAVTNGFAAPGSWTSPDTFGDTEALVRCVGDIGFYVYSLPISQQSGADRLARKAPLVQIAIKAAGAVHSSNVIVNVNQ